MKTAEKTAHWDIFYDLLELTSQKGNSSENYMTSLFTKLRSGEYTLFELRLFCYFAPLKHCAEAIQLSEELSKVLGHLP